MERAGTSQGKMLFAGVLREHQPTLPQERSWCWNDRQEASQLSDQSGQGRGLSKAHQTWVASTLEGNRDARVDDKRDLPVDQRFRDGRHVPVWQICIEDGCVHLIRMQEF